MTKLASVFFAGALWVAAASKTYTGVVTDAMCGKDHKMMHVSPDAKCVVECVKAGSQYALLVVDKVYILSDQRTPEKFAAKKVKVTGTLVQKTNTIKVDSIAEEK
jgi:hypothetical protein